MFAQKHIRENRKEQYDNRHNIGQAETSPPPPPYNCGPENQPYPPTAAGGYPAMPPGEYPAMPPGGYPAMPPGGYPAMPPGGYPAMPPGGYPAVPPGGEYYQGSEKMPLNYGMQNAGYHPQGPYCAQPQQQGYVQQQQPNVIFVQATPLANAPQDHLGYSIFVTICCCWIIGIFAIIKASECRSAVSAGDRPTAELRSRQAKKLANIALGLGIVSVVCSVVLIAVYYGVLLSSMPR